MLSIILLNFSRQTGDFGSNLVASSKVLVAMATKTVLTWRVAMRWTPTGRRKRRRPKTTWQRTVMKELEEMGLSWGEAQAKAWDMVQCWSIVMLQPYHYVQDTTKRKSE